MSINFEKEEENIENLNNDAEFFEMEFEKIKNSYPMIDSNEIHDFLKNKPGIIVALNEIRPLLDDYVPYAKFHLILDDDPLFVPQLLLMVNAPKDKFGNGFKGNIRKINSSIRQFLLEFDLIAEFFIFEGSIRDNH